MSSVGILECKSYDPEEVKEAIRVITSPFDKKKIEGKKIALYFDFPAPNPVFLREVIRFLKGAGVSEIVAGTSVISAPVPGEITDMLEWEGVKFVDFREDKYEKLTVPLHGERMPDHFRGYALLSPVQYSRELQLGKMNVKGKRILKHSFLPLTLTEADCIVPVVKLKVSPVTVIGGVVSSVLSIVPTLTRNEIFINKLKYQMEQAIVEVYGLIQERMVFGFVDAVEADLTGDKELDKMNAILFSEDGFALDSLSAVLIGYRSRDVKTNKVGDELGFGSGLFSHVSLFGDEFLHFRKDLVKFLKYGRYGSLRGKKPRVLKNDAERISKIETFCPTGAIKFENGQYKIDRHSCISCMYCVQLLPDLFGV
ncbi:MAG: DUF362 domain-containing protein [Caldisericaceae bacterium]|nr:DUF362 domain-containing protein [Caldisericaceae bacterium]